MSGRVRLALWLAALAAAPVAGQPLPSLDRVDSLVAEGRTEDARTVLTAWLSEAGARSRADQQRGLWLRALLTVDPAQAATDYQRLVLEHPGGPFSDRALLRLAQAARAQGETERARERLTTLLRDYPGSPWRLEAAALLEALGPTQAASAEAPSPEARPLAATEPPAPRSDPDAAGRWTVQLGAFASPARARGLLDRLRGEGVEARLVLVSGSPLIRVRAGRYASRAEADRARDRMAVRDRDAAVVGDADREEPAP